MSKDCRGAKERRELRKQGTSGANLATEGAGVFPSMSRESWIALQAAARPGRNRCRVQFGGCVRLGKQLLRIEKFLGKGGFGAVFQARNTVRHDDAVESLRVTFLRIFPF